RLRKKHPERQQRHDEKHPWNTHGGPPNNSGAPSRQRCSALPTALYRRSTGDLPAGPVRCYGEEPLPAYGPARSPSGELMPVHRRPRRGIVAGGDQRGRFPVRFEVLGPLRVSLDGDCVRLVSGRQRALLTALILHANRTVSVQRLIAALWDEDAPPS